MTPDPANRYGAPYPPPYGYGPPPAPKPSWRGRLVVLFTGLALFLIACACPALIFKRNASEIEVWPGFQVLGVGWLGILIGQIAWYANLVMVLALIFLLARRWLTAGVIALVALVVASDAWLLFSKEVPADEAGVNKLMLQHLGVGFYFWMASMGVIIVGALILRRRSAAGG